jgi:hypothetical protein
MQDADEDNEIGHWPDDSDDDDASVFARLRDEMLAEILGNEMIA